MIARLVGACLLLAALAPPARAQTERLYSRGLGELQAGRPAEALKLFDQAVAADPANIDALYYRGLTRLQLGDFAQGAADLGAAREARPDSAQIALDLGIALVQADRYEEALEPLEQAQKNRGLQARASFFLGLAQRRLRRYDAARDNLLRAAADPELQLAASYYRGVIAYEQSRWDDAEREFSTVVALKPESEMGREAAKFLDNLRAVGRTGRRFVHQASVAFQYDSNVALTPSDDLIGDVINDATGVSDEADGRVVFSGSIGYVPWSDDLGELTVGYEFFRSLHFDLTQFDLEDHRANVDLRLNEGRFSGGLLAHYDYYRLDNHKFLEEVSAVPWLSVRGGDHWRTEISYRMRRRDFRQDPYNGVLDGYNHLVGVRQYYQFGSWDRYVWVGYQADQEDPSNDSPPPGTTVDPDSYGYDGHEFNTGGGWKLPYGVALEGSYAYRYESYEPASDGREDKAHEFAVALTKKLMRYLDVSAGYFGTINGSNDPAFEYDRHIGSISLGVRF